MWQNASRSGLRSRSQSRPITSHVRRGAVTDNDVTGPGQGNHLTQTPDRRAASRRSLHHHPTHPAMHTLTVTCPHPHYVLRLSSSHGPEPCIKRSQSTSRTHLSLSGHPLPLDGCYRLFKIASLSTSLNAHMHREAVLRGKVRLPPPLTPLASVVLYEDPQFRYQTRSAPFRLEVSNAYAYI